jgi:hypothetical protein
MSERQLVFLHGSATLLARVNVAASEFKFVLSAKTAKRGVVTFRVTNVGKVDGVYDYHDSSRYSPDGGLVGIAEGFDLNTYRVIFVERFIATQLDIYSEADRAAARSIPIFLQHELVRRLRQKRLFADVVNLDASSPPREVRNMLVLQGYIIALSAGSQDVAGLGVCRTNVQVEMRFFDRYLQKTMLVTADRRVGTCSKVPVDYWDGDSERLLRESVSAIARDVVGLLMKLSVR